MENKMFNMKLTGLFAAFLFAAGLSAGIAAAVDPNDVLVWQGQYYTGTTFNEGTYEFNFTVYDSSTAGTQCYSNKTNITTGHWGQWETEQSGVNYACNNASKDYYLNINIDGADQLPRKRLTTWNFLRKNVDETSIGSIETDIIKVRIGLKDLNKAIWQFKLDYAQESANTTLSSQQDLALKIINITYGINSAVEGESLELRITRLQQAGEEAKAIIESDTEIAIAKILEAKRLALLNGVTAEDMAAIEEEARLKVVALNLTAQEQKAIIESAINSSITEVSASDDGRRFAVKDADGRLNLSSGNLTTTGTGFFSYLGSLAVRITKLFVQDIDATGNIETSQNVSANYFKGDGSLLTNLPAGINGTNGKDGVNGTQGPQGIQGIQGEKGDKGDTGAQGIQGIPGTNGTNGVSPNYLGGDLNATNAARVNVFTIALTPSKVNVIHAYLAQSSSTNGVAIQNRAIISASGPIGNCHFVTQTGAGAEAVDNIAVSNNSADTSVANMALGINVPFINTVTCAVLADASQRNLTVQFISETASTVTTHAGSYYTNAVS